MATWTLVEGLMADNLPIRLYMAERGGKLWGTRLHDDEHPRTEDEFVWSLGAEAKWERCKAASGPEVLQNAHAQLSDYFAGRNLSFDLPFQFRGTPFQVRVWEELIRIPFGARRTYSEMAERIGQPKACRAVGSANGRNNLPLFVPCHRVLASGGKLGGFTGGIRLKKRLLEHESAVLARCRAA